LALYVGMQSLFCSRVWPIIFQNNCYVACTVSISGQTKHACPSVESTERIQNYQIPGTSSVFGKLVRFLWR